MAFGTKMSLTNTKPTVTIVTPVFNASKWIRSLIDCVSEQTFTDFEHLIIDDCSSEDEFTRTSELIADFPKIRLIRLVKNSGPAIARNEGIANARGRYIAFLDADDFWMPQKLEIQVGFMRTTGTAFSFHDYCHLSADGTLIGDPICGPDVLDFKSHHIRRGTGGCLSVMIDMQQVKSFNFPMVEKKFPEDFLGWSELIRKGHLGYRVPHVLGMYRIHEGNRSGNKLKVVLSVLETYLAIERVPIYQAFPWWLMYCLNSFKQYKNARPYKPLTKAESNA
jgi:teichuronic acid biosynthesis glycosyltransferase TuaG